MLNTELTIFSLCWRFVKTAPNNPSPVWSTSACGSVKLEADGRIVVRWKAVAAARYQVQCKANLTELSWFNAGDAVTATGNTVEQIVPRGSAPPKVFGGSKTHDYRADRGGRDKYLIWYSKANVSPVLSGTERVNKSRSASG